jgi:hypothetical protein
MKINYYVGNLATVLSCLKSFKQRVVNNFPFPKNIKFHLTLIVFARS